VSLRGLLPVLAPPFMESTKGARIRSGILPADALIG